MHSVISQNICTYCYSSIQSDPALSESTIKTAIEAVARAGYLTLTPANPGGDQTFTEGDDTPCASKTSKRTREEMEQGAWLIEEKGNKKQHNKIVLPPHVQSSWYDALQRIGYIFAYLVV
jgi:hypothetical protein